MLKQLWRDNRRLLWFMATMLVFRASCADWLLVPTGSMNPTIIEGDYILTNKHAYGWRVPFTLTRLTPGTDPQRGDIAVFESPVDGMRLVKRVIGIPGDRIEMRDEMLLINGQAVRYTPTRNSPDLLSRTQALAPQTMLEHLDSGAHAVQWLPDQPARRHIQPLTIPPDQYLMLGDNRDNSADSRYFGLVSRELFLGRASRVLISFNTDRWLMPRWSRIGQPLDQPAT